MLLFDLDTIVINSKVVWLPSFPSTENQNEFVQIMIFASKQFYFVYCS